jgi:hypothetical protein
MPNSSALTLFTEAAAAAGTDERVFTISLWATAHLFTQRQLRISGIGLQIFKRGKHVATHPYQTIKSWCVLDTLIPKRLEIIFQHGGVLQFCSDSSRVIAELMMVRCRYLSQVDGEIMAAVVSEGAEDNASVVIGQVIEVVAVM